MGFSVSITHHPENMMLQWEWSVKNPQFTKLSMRDPWASMFSDQRWGFGFTFTKRGAERAARSWVKRYLKHQAKYGPAPEVETIDIEI